MDAAQIQAKVDFGFGKAAAVAGFPFELYRPTDPMRPLRLVDRVMTVKAVFDARPSLKFTTPALHTDAVRYAVVDGSLVQHGDYLVGETETLFVANKPPFYAATCVLCNAVVSMRRLTDAAGFGAIADRSDAVSSEAAVFEGWPASVLFSGRGRTSSEDIPGDMPDPEYMILLPRILDVPVPRPGDVMVDDSGRRMAVGWQESSPLGWRIIARLLTTG